jgi:PST family polysaccharide transporter
VLARLAAGPVEDVSSAFVRFWHVLLAVNTGLYAVLFLLADRIVVIDPRWAQSAPLLRILCGYGLLMSLLIVAHDAVRAIGRPGAYLRAMILHLVLLVVGAVAAVRWAGSAGVAWAQVGAAAVTLVVVTVVLARAGVVTGAVLGALRGPGVATAAVVAGQLLAGRAGLLPAADSLGGVLVLGPLLGVSYLAVLAVVDRAALADLRVALSRDRSAADG